MQSGMDFKEPSCKDKFEFAMHQRITPGMKITLSVERLNSENIGYHHPQVPLVANKAKPAYME